MEQGAQVIGGDRFVIQERLGGGGGGDVFRAHDRERGVDVAIKLLKKGDPTALYRFKTEFRALSDVAHPNLVEYYELVAREDQWFITMELVDGVDLLTFVRHGDELEGFDEQSLHGRAGAESGAARGGDWDDEEDTAVTRTGTGMPQRRGLKHAAQFERLRHAIEQLAEGVVALHEAGHLHRDIKPSNVMIDRGGRLVILDFGVVTELQARGAASDGDDHIVGTPAYMAPEQAAGEALSKGSDWYSVGVVLYEALTGGRPFGGSVRSSLEARKRFDPPPPSTFAPGTPTELDDLCMALLRREADERPSGDEVLRMLGIRRSFTSAAEARISSAAELVGREPHMKALREAFDEACRGRSHAVLVHGAAGMGKTALVQAFLRDISDQRRAIVLEGRCYEHESMPYKALDPVVDALSRYLLSLPHREVEALMPDDIGALARLFPVLRRVEAVVGGAAVAPETTSPADLRRRAVAALRAMIEALAKRRPLVLYIDDLQWGDTDSAAVIQELLRPPQTPGMLFLASYRSEDAGTSPFLRALLPLPSVPIELGLAPLSSAETLVIAERLLGGVAEILPGIGRSISRESGGNPFFVHELVRYVQAETFSDVSLGAITLEEVIRVRLSELPEGARRLVDVIAVAGHPVSPATARRATELGPELDSAVHILRARKLIRTRGGGERGAGAMEPYHDRIREVAVMLLSPDELRDVHRRLAVALSVEAEPDPEALADHFRGAGDLERAADYTARAAEQASRALAFERAAELYRRALGMRPYAEPDKARMLGALGHALSDAGRGKEAADVFREAAAIAPPSEALTFRRSAGEQLIRVGHIDAGIEIIDSVIRELGMRVPGSRLGSIVSLLWRRLWLRVRGMRYTLHDPSEIAPVELSRLDACWAASAGLAMIDTIGSLDLQTRHLLLALRSGEPHRLARALALEAGYLSTGGTRGRKRVQELLDEARKVSSELDAPDLQGWIFGIRGLSAYQVGDFEDGLASCLEAQEILRQHSRSLFFEQTSVALYIIWARYYLGDLADVARQVPLLLAESEARADLYSATNFVTGLCVASWLVRDEAAEVRVLGEEAMARWSHRDYHLQHYWYLVGSAMTALYEGDPDRIWRVYTEHWEPFRRTPIRRIEIVMHEALSLEARSLLACSDRRDLLGQAQKCARKLRRRKLPYAVAWSHMIEAAVARKRGDADRAVREFAAAEALLEENGMRADLAACRWRRGQLLGGDEGEALVAEARVFFETEGVVDPDKMVQMLAPE